MMQLLRSWTDSHMLPRLILIASVALVVSGLVFIGYYISDRYIHLGDQSPVEMGIARLEKLVRENPRDPQIRIALAQYYCENGMYQQAIDQAQQVLSAYPETNAAMLILGVSYLNIGEIELANEQLEQFVKIRRQSPTALSDNVLESALYYLGESFLKLGRSSEAIAVLREAITINITDADAIFLLGQAYAQRGQPDLAVEQYLNAVRFDPKFIEAYIGMEASYDALNLPYHRDYAVGMQAFVEGDLERALEHLKRAVENLQNFAPAFLGLGLVQEQLNNFTAARINFNRVLELDPSNYMARHALGRIDSMEQ